MSEETQLIPLQDSKRKIRSSTNNYEKKGVRTTNGNFSKCSSMEEGATIAWNDLSISARTKINGKHGYKRIINSVSGALKPGSLAALMGASGAGKSTLMSALGYRLGGEMSVEGEILINGKPIDSCMKHLSGYMHQEDLFLGSLTVFEHMMIMANLKMDRRISYDEKKSKIMTILNEIGLRKCRNTKIGIIGQNNKGLSGGEKKRLAFATEVLQRKSFLLLTDPPILFCDEPTTGLDSFSAQKIVCIMSKMSMTGKTILCTIHQPSSAIFEMFSQLILVADGRIAFMGGRAVAIDFFEKLGFICPSAFSPADFFIKTLGTTPGYENNSKMTVKKICDNFLVSDYAKEIDVVVQYEFHMGRAEPDREFELRRNFKPTFWWIKLYWLIMKWAKDAIRNPYVQNLRILQRIVIAIIVGLSFYGTNPYTQKGIQAIQGLIFIFASENTFSPMYGILAKFPDNIPLFLREFQSGLYHPLIYYVSRILALLPGLIIEPILFGCIAYWMAGLRATSYAFLITILITVLTTNVSCACGIMFSCAFNSVPNAMAYLVPFDYLLMITSGLFIQRRTIPRILGWTRYFSWMMYAIEAMSIIQWQGIENISCDNGPNGNLSCIKNGDSVLDQYSFSESNLSCDIWNMIFLLIGFHSLSYILLWWKAKKR